MGNRIVSVLTDRGIPYRRVIASQSACLESHSAAAAQTATAAVSVRKTVGLSLVTKAPASAARRRSASDQPPSGPTHTSNVLVVTDASRAVRNVRNGGAIGSTSVKVATSNSAMCSVDSSNVCGAAIDGTHARHDCLAASIARRDHFLIAAALGLLVPRSQRIGQTAATPSSVHFSIRYRARYAWGMATASVTLRVNSNGRRVICVICT